ncbi:MAG: hypothetical protein DRG59_09970 [Deltaproteobacteria bacterium]|nr:MAG: hypothetical protein DRG59_09970 [Deltaproteobacteria bacterium]
MAEESLRQLTEDLSRRNQELESIKPLSEFFDTETGEFGWLITPDQFVDFWVAAVFLLVGTWQIITMFFLVIG